MYSNGEFHCNLTVDSQKTLNSVILENFNTSIPVSIILIYMLKGINLPYTKC